MTERVECNQTICEETAEYKVYWPGSEPVSMCREHKEKACATADAMGFSVHTEEIVREDLAV